MKEDIKIGIIYIIGVSGSGKTTIGKLLAKKLKVDFFDADDYHPKANLEKMANGQALDDSDRASWLLQLHNLAANRENEGAIIACSALKKKYRKTLRENLNQVHMVYLQGSYELIAARLATRKDHFMPETLLRSQFKDLEIPKNATEISIDNTPLAIVNEILTKIDNKL